MSYANELNETFNELRDLPEDLQRSLTSKFGKLTGLKLLTGETALQRDSARLDARQRAYYKKMGLDVDDGEMITNILADNITIGEDPVIAKRNVSDVSLPQDGNTAQPQPAPAPQPPAAKLPPWAKWAIGALLGSNVAGAGLLAWYLAQRPTTPPPTDAGGSIFRFETELPEWMDDEE